MTAPHDVAAPALRAFFRIASAWGLDDAESRTLLGAPPEPTYSTWKRGEVDAVRLDVLERVSFVLGIYEALHVLLPDPAAADGWVRRPNSAAPFSGRSALDLMLEGRVSDLFAVREYLDSERGG